MPFHVLIVDNQRGVSRLLRSVLETIEHDLIVSEVQSGEEAILAARHSSTDLLISDFRLPGITGVELMKKFRFINPDCKVIMISDIVDPRLRKQVTEAGANAFFPKPVPLSDFLDAVEGCLGLARTILHPSEESQPETPVEQDQPGLSGLLVNLRKNISAIAVLLLNDMGEVVAEAGQIPGPDYRVALVSALMGLFNAAQKAASLIDHAGSHLHLFEGQDLDGIFLPVGPTNALLLVGKGIADARALPTRLELIFSARQDVLKALEKIGSPLSADIEMPQQVPAVEEPETQVEELPGDFMNIFDQIGQKTDDANSFWDSVIEKGTTFTEPDKLTFDQASRLGLAPDSAQEK
jgi:DNA-binding NarL/FixJ family response regulator